MGYCGLLTLSSQLVYSIIEVLLGGRTAFDPRRIDGRPFTGIERALTKRLTGVLLGDMAAAFAQLGPIEFRLERLETNPRHAAIGRPTDGAMLFTIRADMHDRGGRFEIVLPHAALEPVRDLLLQMFGGEEIGSNSLWAAHLKQQTLMSTIELEAVLEEQIIPLAEVMGLAVGTTLRLNASADTPVILRRGQVPVLRGQMGRVSDRIAIRIEERLARAEAWS
jgi:flagellar motor switch protein FliM